VREELDLPMKMTRLKPWCDDLNRVQSAIKYGFIYVPQDEYEKARPKNCVELEAVFKEFR
jgi:type III restriction enzyme